ncbi:MAG: ORF6N domain-containing protein [Pseudomonadota bacterium]|nr:ORF6N domain-containing protein [Pseudomonadota bacterium]
MATLSPRSAAELTPGVESRIHVIRGQRVMLSHDLAELYGIETKVLMQAVRRNLDRFPEDFQFSLTDQEFMTLRSQTVTSSWGGTRYAPVAFTEQGVAMLSSVLRSPQAVAVNIQIVRTFVRLRGMLAEHAELKRQIAALERKYDGQFEAVFEAIHQIMTPPPLHEKKRIDRNQD